MDNKDCAAVTRQRPDASRRPPQSSRAPVQRSQMSTGNSGNQPRGRGTADSRGRGGAASSRPASAAAALNPDAPSFESSQFAGDSAQFDSSNYNYSDFASAHGESGSMHAEDDASQPGHASRKARAKRIGGEAVNVNHLLQFSFATPAPATQHGPAYGRHRPRTSSAAGHARGKHPQHQQLSRPLSKEQFVQANCQFYVSELGDYSVNFADADVPVEWNDIEQVVLRSHGPQLCPICLGPPLAARITRCGHVFCWSCILHHLSTSDKDWHTCPLCEEHVYEKDLRSVAIRSVQTTRPGDQIHMTLLRRPRDSVVVEAVVSWGKRSEENASSQEDVFWKVRAMSGDDVQRRIIDVERSELMLADASDEPFVHHAMQLLADRETAVQKRAASVAARRSREAVERAATAHQQQSQQQQQQQVHSDEEESGVGGSCGGVVTQVYAPDPQTVAVCPAAFSDDEGDDNSKSHSSAEKHADTASMVSPADMLARMTLGSPSSSSASPSKDTASPKKAGTAEPPAEPKSATAASSTSSSSDALVYLYASSDGQPLFLHSINTRSLLMEFTEPGLFPPVLQAPVLEIERLFMTEDLRHRHKHLSHIPLNCEIGLCELDLSSVLSPATLAVFASETNKRKQERRKRAAQERRWDRQIQQQHEKDLQAALSQPAVMTADVYDTQDFPPAAPSAPDTLTAGRSPPANAGSFSKALVRGIMSDAPALGSPPQHTFAPQTRGWAAKAVRPPTQTTPSKTNSEEDEFAPPPFEASFQLSLDGALAADDDGNNSSSTKKGKKPKKKLLFSTASLRHD
eukprot:m.148823 g.148823  ORF g.148823 m.148823 type:complete len:801 (+) comp16840_c0_seq1:405-2807(+)